MSENLALLGAYSDAMARGDREAVFEFWSPDFVSHVTDRVNPAAVGTDVRGHELEWWTQVRDAFPDMVFSVGLLIEKGDLAGADQSRGRFRSFLLSACQHFLANEWDRTRAQKRRPRAKH